MQTAFAKLKSESVPGMFFMISWYHLDEVKALAEKYYGKSEGAHATPSEVAVTRFLRPEAFEGKAGQPGTVENPAHSWPLSAEEMRRVFPDGRMQSAPWLAKAEHGEVLAKAAAEAISRKLDEWMALDVP